MADSKVVTAGHAGGHSHGSHHITPISTYFKTMIALLCLTILTTLVARPVTGFNIGIFNTFLNFLIAAIKGSLVLAFFMGLKYDKKIHLVIFSMGLFFLLVFLSFCLLDIYTRVHVISPLVGA